MWWFSLARVRSNNYRAIAYGQCLWEFIMIEYAKTWLELKLDRRAVTALEYGLIAGVIVATIAVGFSLLANSLSSKFSSIGGSI
jgi:pilus assembly protein Flp/PilA